MVIGDFQDWWEFLFPVCVCVLTSFPSWETLSAAKTVAVLANSCASPPRGALRAFGGHFILIGLRLNDLVDLIL